MKTFSILSVAVAALSYGVTAFADDPVQAVETVTEITSDRLDFDYNDYIAVFEGKVKVKDPRFTLDSDKMLVFFDGTNGVKRIDAVGHVVAVRDDITATCGKAIYTKKNGAIVLENEPIVKKGKNDSIEGPRMVIWMADNRIEVQNGVRLRGTPGAMKKKESTSSTALTEPKSLAKPVQPKRTTVAPEYKPATNHVASYSEPLTVQRAATAATLPKFGVPAAAVAQPQPVSRAERRRRWEN